MPQNIDAPGDPGSPNPGPVGPARGPNCDDIPSPVRRSLCKACSAPVIGAAPFCREHLEIP